MCDLLFSPAAERYLKKLRETSLRDAYRAAFLAIMENPYIGTQKRGDLSGIYRFDFRHLGVNYEIAYTIRGPDEPKVVVLLVGTRENPCEQLKRYMR